MNDQSPENEHVLTTEEKAAIRSLQRLAKKWPRTLSLLSWSGTLVVVPTAERDEPHADRSITILGIPNDGGDPDGNLGDHEGPTWEDQMVSPPGEVTP